MALPFHQTWTSPLLTSGSTCALYTHCQDVHRCRLRAAPDPIYIKARELDIGSPVRSRLAQKPEPMEQHCRVGRSSYLWCLGFSSLLLPKDHFQPENDLWLWRKGG